MHSTAKPLILIFQMLALIAFNLNMVFGASSSLDNSEKSEILPLKSTDINYDPVLSKESLDSDALDLYDEQKRAQWNNLQGNHQYFIN